MDRDVAFESITAVVRQYVEPAAREAAVARVEELVPQGARLTWCVRLDDGTHQVWAYRGVPVSREQFESLTKSDQQMERAWLEDFVRSELVRMLAK